MDVVVVQYAHTGEFGFYFSNPVDFVYVLTQRLFVQYCIIINYLGISTASYINVTD